MPSKDNLSYRGLRKNAFVGYFRLCDADEAGLLDEIEGEEEFDGYSLAMGFSDAKIEVGYGFEEFDNPPSFFKKGERKKGDPSSISLSLVFGRLETPEEYTAFVQRFGPLFGFEENIVGKRLWKEAGAEALAAGFERKPTEGELRKAAAIRKIEKTESSTPHRFEYVGDWIVASRLMRKAFLFQELLTEGFTVEKIESRGKIVEYALCDGEGVDVLHVVRDGSFAMLRLEEISDENDYIRRCFLERPVIGEGRVCYGGEPGVTMRQMDSGAVCLACEEPRSSSIVGVMRRILERSLEYLVRSHRVNMGFSLHNGTAFYDFDSLLSFLWFDFVMVGIGAKDFTVCKLCGKPIFQGAQGPKRRFCDDACRQAAGRKRKRGVANG